MKATAEKKVTDDAEWDDLVGSSTCHEWYAAFKKVEFNLEGRQQEFESEYVQALSDGHATQLILELAYKELFVNHSTILRNFHNTVKIFIKWENEFDLKISGGRIGRFSLFQFHFLQDTKRTLFCE